MNFINIIEVNSSFWKVFSNWFMHFFRCCFDVFIIINVKFYSITYNLFIIIVRIGIKEE